jgi:hypothetical protein
MMKKWTLLATLALACGTTSGKSTNPDDGELSTFEQFSLWGKGMAGFTAPPSNQVAGDDDTASWTDGDGDWDADADDGSDADGGEEMGACWLGGECYEVSYDDCVASEGTWEGGSCPDGASIDSNDSLDLSTSTHTAGGVK